MCQRIFSARYTSLRLCLRFFSVILFSDNFRLSCTVKDSLCVIYVSLSVLDFSFSTSYLVLRLLNHFFLVCCYLFRFIKVIFSIFFLLFSVSLTSFSIGNFLLLLFNVFWCYFILNCLRLIYFRLSIILFGLCLVFFSLRLVFLSLCFIYCLGRFIKFSLGHVNLSFSDFLSRNFHFSFLRRFFLYQGWFGLSSCRQWNLYCICVSSSDCADKTCSCCDGRNNRTRIQFFSSTMTIFRSF